VRRKSVVSFLKSPHCLGIIPDTGMKKEHVSRVLNAF
jgi:hypothetical protein